MNKETNTQKDSQNCVDKQGTTQSLDQPNNRYEIHEIHGKSGQTTDGQPLFWAKIREVKCDCPDKTCNGIHPKENIQELPMHTNNRIREEWRKVYFQTGEVTYTEEDGTDRADAEKVCDWWLSKIAELLKSQKESLVEELKIIEKMPGVHLALHDFIQNLIKEDK